ncbi:MAG: hypothetical protein HYV19_02300 [Gemmatimonadetes bacterium]|nr:hypothetical protein [Gemmatimonadota bacterium]
MSRLSRSCFALLALLATAQLAGAQQANDQEYTKKIKEYLQDPRISTEFVDHLPASSSVPTPLKFLGKIVGTPGELTYAKDIHRYLEAVAKASNGRAKFWTIGKTEEGRDMVLMAIGDAATISQLDKYKGMLKSLTDPRKTSEAEAQRLINSAKPIYWITSGLHSPENGGPEMLMELAYRLVVDESPFYQDIRKNVITFITPVLEVDGREKQVDTYYFNKKRAAGEARLPLMYWGKYVQHDNNRDGMGQLLAITRNTTKFFLEWTPTIMHDLHESVTYLYASTGSGPYNEQIDAITVNEWWDLAINEVQEMAKRNVPGVWTYGFYDGWTPNYLFYVAHAHNATGRFYEVQSYGPDNYVVRPPATTTSREWFRPNPPLATINWGPRNNTNIQESAMLLSLSHVAKNRAHFLENYWLKNKRSVDKGKNGPTYAWVIPAGQHKKADAADAVNDLMTQGLEFHRATSAFKAGTVNVQPGDYIIRADQPYRTLADMYFSVQAFSAANPSPYDDTGWTFQYMRDLTITPVSDKAILTAAMTPITGKVTAAGGVDGSGSTLIVAATSDNNLTAFRFKNADVKMAAAEEDFEAGGRKFQAGSFIIANADRAKLEPQLKALGLSGVAVAAAPTVKSHDLDVPRIGYMHSWTRTQDEGWVRASLDYFGVPYTYFADQLLRSTPNLRAKYDVIIYPHVSGTPQSIVAGMPNTGTQPLPYKKSAETPNLGFVDASDDIRGGMGLEGLMNLYKFVQEGGTLITEGATSALFPQFNLTNGVTVETPSDLFVRGSILRGIIADKKSPLTYGYAGTQLPVYFNSAPVLNAGGTGAGGFGGFGRGSAQSQNVTPMANQPKLSTWDATAPAPAAAAAPAPGGRGAGGGFGGFGAPTGVRPRVILSFPTSADDMLLSGSLVNGQALSGRAQLVDAPVGKGHVVMFAIRPFWRWQTQGTYSLGFNAIMNWNDLDAGKR